MISAPKPSKKERKFEEKQELTEEQLRINKIHAQVRLAVVDRKILSPSRGFVLLCPVCDQIIDSRTGFDVHEALITRGMAQGPEQWRIFDERQSVARHHICNKKHYHQPGNDSPEVYLKIVKFLVQHEGAENIKDFFRELRPYFKASMIDNAGRKFSLAHNGVTHGQ